MTKKRFRVVHSPVTQKFVVVDNEHEEIFEGIKNRDNACRFSNLLNALHEENERLHNEVFRLKTELAYDRTVNDGKDWFKAEDEHLTFKTEKW